MSLLIREVDHEQWFLLTVSYHGNHTFKWRIGCAITGAFLKGGEGYKSVDLAEEAMKKYKVELCI